jgi:hypothetical protein
MFGDAFSPYLIGALADTFKPHIHLHQPPTVLQLQVTAGIIRLIGWQIWNF